MTFSDGDLLVALHEGMHQQPLWHGFLEKLRAGTGSIYASLYVRRPEEDAIIGLYAGKAPTAYFYNLFIDKFAHDPLAYRHMREGRIYALEELIDPEDPVHRDYLNELLLPQGVSSIRSVRISVFGGVDVWLACAGGRNVGSSAGAILNSIAPHLRIAIRNFLALEKERFKASVTSDAFGRLRFGWIALDEKCHIIEMSPHVVQLLERTAALRRGRYDRLLPSSPTIDRELTSLIKSYAKQRNMRPRAFNISRDPWMDMLVTPAPHHVFATNMQPTAIAYVSGDRRSQAERSEQLEDLFGLLPSEARFAWTLARGLSIAEAAQELGITLETARTYSKKIYLKTGVRGQTELVRNILTSVLAIM